MGNLWTSGDLARDLNEHRHVINYWIEKEHIQECRRVGNSRLYDEAAREKLLRALRRAGRQIPVAV